MFGVELAFLSSESAVGIEQVSDDPSDVLCVLFGVFGVDNDVVEVCRAVIEPMMENAVDKTLEYCRCVLKPEWHDVVLEEACLLVS